MPVSRPLEGDSGCLGQPLTQGSQRALLLQPQGGSGCNQGVVDMPSKAIPPHYRHQVTSRREKGRVEDVRWKPRPAEGKAKPLTAASLALPGTAVSARAAASPAASQLVHRHGRCALSWALGAQGSRAPHPLCSVPSFQGGMPIARPTEQSRERTG